MENKKFGNQLRFFRQQTLDPKTDRPLTQQGLGGLLRDETGIRYSGAAVSDWERNQSGINAGDRILLTGLVKILRRYGGIKTAADADLLLEAGNYRALNPEEKNEIFPEETGNYTPPQEHHHNPVLSFDGSLFFNLSAEFQKILAEAGEGPPPAWPRVVVAVINKATGRWTVFHTLRFLAWLWIWLIMYGVIAPSLQWPFASRQSAVQAMALYAAGTIVLPALISAMIDVKGNPFWREQKAINALTFRLFVYQGASIGFHLGYFFILAFSLAQFYFHIRPAAWVEFIKMLAPLSIGSTGAHLVPYNLWRAHGRLQLKDGGIFFIFVVLGPLWAWFFIEFYEAISSPFLGIITILTAATMLAIREAAKKRKTGNTDN